MLDTTADTWPTWLGVIAASVAVAGVAVGLPTAPPPDPAAAAVTVDRVAASPYSEHERVELDAAELRLGADRIALRSSGGTAHATFAYPVVPVRGPPLARVLAGAPPEAVYGTPAAFRAALERAGRTEPRWRPAPERLTVRRVRWEGIDATLVG